MIGMRSNIHGRYFYNHGSELKIKSSFLMPNSDLMIIFSGVSARPYGITEWFDSTTLLGTKYNIFV